MAFRFLWEALLTQLILDLIAWVNATALSLCDSLGVNPMAVVTVVAVAGMAAYLFE